MLNPDRPPIFLEDHVLELGKDAYQRYSSESDNSSIPESFLGIPNKFAFEYFPDLSSVGVAEIVFETRFENDRQAWLALRYAEAIASIKKFNSLMMYDADGPIIEKDDIDKMFVQIGVSVANEFEDDTTEAVKESVEGYFDTHPLAMARLELIAKQVESGIVH